MSKEAIDGPINPQYKINQIIQTDRFLSHLSGIDNVEPALGGVSHEVFRITSDGKRYYVKKRGINFAKIPEISSNPADIINEYNALTIFNEFTPDNFPQVLSINENQFYLVLSDSMPKGELLEKLFLDNKVTAQTIFNVGNTLKRIHSTASQYTQDIRPEGDNRHYEKKLQDRFGYRQNNALNELIDDLRNTQRHLILGDTAPKNIGVNYGGENITFFDLEDAHQGNIVFDYGYLLGHILLHTFTSPKVATESINSFTQGYGNTNFKDETVKRIVLGIMLYRLDSVIPYPVPNIHVDDKVNVQERIESLLISKLDKSTWPNLINELNYGKN